MLAEGSTSQFRLKRGARILLARPESAVGSIIPMGGL